MSDVLDEDLPTDPDELDPAGPDLTDNDEDDDPASLIGDDYPDELEDA